MLFKSFSSIRRVVSHISKAKEDLKGCEARTKWLKSPLCVWQQSLSVSYPAGCLSHILAWPWSTCTLSLFGASSNEFRPQTLPSLLSQSHFFNTQPLLWLYVLLWDDQILLVCLWFKLDWPPIIKFTGGTHGYRILSDLCKPRPAVCLLSQSQNVTGNVSDMFQKYKYIL